MMQLDTHHEPSQSRSLARRWHIGCMHEIVPAVACRILCACACSRAHMVAPRKTPTTARGTLRDAVVSSAKSALIFKAWVSAAGSWKVSLLTTKCASLSHSYSSRLSCGVANLPLMHGRVVEAAVHILWIFRSTSVGLNMRLPLVVGTSLQWRTVA